MQKHTLIIVADAAAHRLVADIQFLRHLIIGQLVDQP